MNILNYQFKSTDIEVSGKTVIKVSSILLTIPRHESIVDTDIAKVLSIVSMSIFDINNPEACISFTCSHCIMKIIEVTDTI